MASRCVPPNHDAHSDSRPGFLITIDTEGDNLWAKPRKITTENTRFLPRFQDLCEKYRLKPTYLTNWEMATSRQFQEFARDVIARGVGEIGMHLHAWNSPPLAPLTPDDFLFHPYLMEYPAHLIREKIKVMTHTLEEVFGIQIISHRAGRSGFSSAYARILVEHGYRVDCSVTPHLSWRAYKGDPKGRGGSDYTDFPEQAYFLDLNDLSKPGDSPLLEVPLTVLPPRYPRIVQLGCVLAKTGGSLTTKLAKHFYPTYVRLVPNGRNRRLLLAVAHSAWQDGRDYIEMSFHSSELMPGCSPNFPTPRSIEKLYSHLEMLFEAAQPHFLGQTLSEYYHRFLAKVAPAAPVQPQPPAPCTSATDIPDPIHEC